MIPEHTKNALLNWVRYGNQWDHGSFLMALVSNQLVESFSSADDINSYYMYDIVKWMYQYLPTSCYGSKENAEAWDGMPEEQFKVWAKYREV